MYPMHLPQGSVLGQDLGFIGPHPARATVEQPFKKPKNGELSFSQLLYNQLCNPMRLVIEQANSGIKRLPMIKDTLRIHCSQFRDTLMVVACGLHNLRVGSPFRNYFNPRAST
jgi:hypothetical protein